MKSKFPKATVLLLCTAIVVIGVIFGPSAYRDFSDSMGWSSYRAIEQINALDAAADAAGKRADEAERNLRDMKISAEVFIEGSSFAARKEAAITISRLIKMSDADRDSMVMIAGLDDPNVRLARFQKIMVPYNK